MTTPSDSPKYLPRIASEREPNVSDAMAERLAFVLCGVEPDEQQRDDYAGKSLKQLLADPTIRRVGPSSSLRDDHQYILSFKYDFSKVDFDELWQSAKVVPTGQAATEFLKLVKTAHRLPLDKEGTELRSPKYAELVKQVHDNAALLLYRYYRTAVRHIEEACQRPPVSESIPWHQSLLKRLGFAKSDSPELRVDDDILQEAKTYLFDVVRLGRFLRVPCPK